MNFTYDNRGLATQISYSVPNGSTIPVTPTVNFSYDALGNRTQMTDGTGTTVYAYNPLSQITAETKTFTGLTGSFTIGYGYQLGGGLKSVTDPGGVNSNIEYAYNKAGQLTTISNGATQIVQNRKLRAFGAVKEEDYGNGFRLNQEYDTRLRLSQFDVKDSSQQSKLKIQYEYNASSEVTRANNVLSVNYNRYFKYDNVGRLKETGTDWSGQTDYPAYSQSFNYDVWSNLTSRSSSIWGYVMNNWNDYQSNRNVRAAAWNSQTGTVADEIWQFDAGGMPTRTGEQTHKYDAAGRKIEAVETSVPPPGQTGRTELLIQQTFDGDGQAVKRFEHETFNTGAPLNKTFYNLNSSVLGGAVLATINEQGIRGETNVYGADGAKIASIGSNLTTWTHEAPITGSSLVSFSNSPSAGGVSEFESLGGALPATPPPAGSPDWIFTGNYQQTGNAFDLNGRCQLNGFPEDCAWVMRTSSPTRYDRKGRRLPEPFEWSAEHHIVTPAIGNWSPYHPVSTPWAGGTQTVRLETEHFGGEHPQTITFLRRMHNWQAQKQTKDEIDKLPKSLFDKKIKHSNLKGLKKDFESRLDIDNGIGKCRDKLNALLKELGSEYESIEDLAGKFLSGKNLYQTSEPIESLKYKNDKTGKWERTDAPAGATSFDGYKMRIIINTYQPNESHEIATFIHELFHTAGKNKTFEHKELNDAVRKLENSSDLSLDNFIGKYCRKGGFKQ